MSESETGTATIVSPEPEQIEGSLAVARAVAACRPQVICAYPISPQTHIVEGLSALVKKGELENCEYVNVESEFGAMSVAMRRGSAASASVPAASAPTASPCRRGPARWSPRSRRAG